MKIVYTEQSFKSLESIKEYLTNKYSLTKAIKIRTEILNEAELLVKFSERGQEEEMLKELQLGHRYILKGHTKIIYRVKNKTIFVTDFFDSRQDPKKIKS